MIDNMAPGGVKLLLPHPLKDIHKMTYTQEAGETSGLHFIQYMQMCSFFVLET